ncbi:MAG: glycosyltransferase [Hydrogenobaculum sp.]
MGKLQKIFTKGICTSINCVKKIGKKKLTYFYPHVNLLFYIPRKTITTIHDLIPLTKLLGRNIFNKTIYSIYIYRTIRKSRKLIAISNTAASDLKQRFNVDENKLNVIYEFIDDKFKNYAKKERPIVRKEYILFVGNRKKHKNLCTSSQTL